MARANTSQEVVHDLRTVGFYADSATTTTTDGAISAGDTSFDVTSAANFAADDVVRIGANGSGVDIGVIKTVATNTITLDHPVVHDHADDVPFVKLTFTDMGATSDAGVSVAYSGDRTAVPAGTQKATYLDITGSNETEIGLALLCASPENLAQALGEDETSSTYVHETPDGVTLDPNAFGSLGYKAWRFQGLREDATVATAYVFSAKVVEPNTTLAFTTGTPMEIPFTIRSNNAIRWTFA
jgi:hypothetical protein